MGPLGVLLFFQLILPTPTKEIRLGLIESDPGLVALCDFAIQKARETGVLQKPVVLLNASGCGGEGAANAARLYFEEEVVGIVASRCVEETLEIARLSFFEGIPVLSRVGSSPSLFDNRRNPMLVGAALTSVAGYAKSLKEFMTSHRISALTLVGPVFDPYDGEVPLHVSLREVLRKEAIRTRVFEFDEKSTREAFFDRVDMTSRLVVFVGDRRLSKKFFSRIDLSGAVESGFLLVIVCDESPAVCTSGIRGTVEKTRALVLSFDDQNTQKVSDELDATFPDTKDTGMEQKLATFDSCFAFCFGASLTSSGDGEEFVRNLRGKSVHSLHRRLAFDETPSVLRSYAFSRFDAISGGFVPVLELTSEPTPDCALTELSTCFEMKGRASSNDFWAAKMNLVVSECVFRGDDCRSHLWLYVAAGILGVLLLVAIVFYCYRRRMSLQIYRLHWKVPAKSFKIIDKPSGGKSTSTAKWNKKRAVNSYMLLGSTKAEFVELAQRGRVDFSRDDLELLTELKKASHDNIAKFLGVHYNEGPRFFFVQTFVERATLDDILKNIDVSERKYESRDPGEDGVGDDELSVDMIFKSGFVHDIIKGLTYLHRTIGYHGWLSTHTCMIDANWVLKLTSFGLGRLLHGFNASGQLLVDNIPLTHYVSIAPEHLGGLHYGSVYPLGSQEGDVYSLGIVATQILFDADPFTDAVLLTHEVLKKIATGATTPSAPRVSSPFEESLKDLVLPCYGAPAARPSIRAVSEHFNKVFQKSRGNLVDQMLARNAQYANQLEGTVNQRTAMLQEAQQMSYKLLCELLPKSVADKMRMGISVEPRSYDSATVLFCQICHFQVFLAHSTPEQVIHFLNNVFTLFDRVIEDRDAYKVETTGETYMVASGVPTENEDRHVFIIADIALRIRNATKDYSDYKPPNWNLEVRMGFHCGPLATGVIGLKSPRYCLFGDTVNFASRMQSNGKPGRILISADANRILTHTVGGYITEHRGEVAIKGKGVTDTYWLVEELGAQKKKDRHATMYTSFQSSEFPFYGRLFCATPLPIPESERFLENDDIILVCAPHGEKNFVARPLFAFSGTPLSVVDSSSISRLKWPSLEEGERVFVTVAPYSTSEPGYLSFDKGTMIVVEGTVEGDWARGVVVGDNGKRLGAPDFILTSFLLELQALEDIDALDDAGAPDVHAFKSVEDSRLPLPLIPIESEAVGVLCEALFDFAGSKPDELSFMAHEEIRVLRSFDDVWFFGESIDGERRGIFPGDFVNLRPFGVEQKPSSVPHSAPMKSESIDEPDIYLGIAFVISDFTARFSDELSVLHGDCVKVLSFVDDDWSFCYSQGSCGRVPTSFLSLFFAPPPFSTDLEERRGTEDSQIPLSETPTEPRDILQEVPRRGPLREVARPTTEHQSERARDSSKEAEKRNHVVGEVISTEATYQRNLKLWITLVDAEESLSEAEKLKLTGGLQELISLSESLLDVLRKEYAKDAREQRIGVAFSGLVERLQTAFLLYVDCYISTYSLDHSVSPEVIDALIREMRERGSSIFDASSFFFEPFLRITRYRLLVEALLSNTPKDDPDRADLLRVYRSVRTLLAAVDGRLGSKLHNKQSFFSGISSHSFAKKSARLKYRIMAIFGQNIIKDYEFDTKLRLLVAEERKISRFLYLLGAYKRRFLLGIARWREANTPQKNENVLPHCMSKLLLLFSDSERVVGALVDEIERRLVPEAKALFGVADLKLVQRRNDKLADYEVSLGKKDVAWRSIRKAEFEALNAKLLADLPRQTEAIRKKTLELALSLLELDRSFSAKLEASSKRRHPDIAHMRIAPYWASIDPDHSRLRPFQKLIEHLGGARECVPKPDWVEADAVSLDASLFGFEFDSKCVVSHHAYDEITAGPRTAALEGDLIDLEENLIDFNGADESSGVLRWTKMAFDFAARGGHEITVANQESVAVLREHDDDGNTEWTLIRSRSGRVGYVPSNYVLA